MSAEVDLAALDAWMSSQGLGEGPIGDVRRLAGGTQNVMLRLERDARTYVLRRPPLHPRPWSERAMRQEMRVLEALARTDVAHPRLVAGCDDPDVIGAVFYLMDEVAGFNPGEGLPAMHAGDPQVRREMGFAVVDALAQLGAVDHDAIGLGDLGRAGFVQRQVDRWLEQLGSYERHDGYEGPDLPGLDDLAEWLRAHQPAGNQPGLMHGDFQLTNVMIAPYGPQVAAIVDWEMCTVGEPLLDLGWLAATWPVGDSPIPALQGLADAGGLPSVPEVLARYAQASDRDLSDIDWYVVLACFKLAIVVEGTYARSRAGKVDEQLGLEMRSLAHALFDRAQGLLAGTWPT
ncbi:MAG TPA: phosphotransferase family protein [Nitriliruptorales bacterium]